MNDYFILENYSLPCFFSDLSCLVSNPNIRGGEHELNVNQLQIKREKFVWDQFVSFIKKNYSQECVILLQKGFPSLSMSEQAYLLKSVHDAMELEVKLLLGHATNIGQIIPISQNLIWLDNFGYSQFLILFRGFYDRIISFQQHNFNSFWSVLNYMTDEKMFLYPMLGGNLLELEMEERLIIIQDIKQRARKVY